MLDNICSGKNLKRLMIIVLVLVLLYLLWPKLKELWYTKFLIAREGYEDIILIVRSKCPPGSYFNTDTNRCLSSDDFKVEGLKLVNKDDSTDVFMELGTTGITNNYYLTTTYPLPQGTNIYDFPDSDLTAVPYVSNRSGIRITTIPLTNLSDQISKTRDSVQLFVSNNADRIKTIIRDNSSMTGTTAVYNLSILSNIIENTNTRLIVESGTTTGTYLLRVITNWSMPIAQDDTSCEFDPSSATTTPRYVNKRQFTITSDAKINNVYAIYVNKFPRVGTTGFLRVNCNSPLNCLFSPDTTKQITGTVERTGVNTYKFTADIPYLITRSSNDISTDPLTKKCNDPTTYPDYIAPVSGINKDTVVRTITSNNTGTSTLKKELNITYGGALEVDPFGSSNIQMLVRKMTSPENTNPTFNLFNSKYVDKFEEFYGDLSRLPLLVLFSIPTPSSGTSNKFINSSYDATTDTMLTTIIGRRLKDSGQDLDITNTDVQSKIREMVNKMTGFAVNEISEIRGIYPTFQIELGTATTFNDLYATRDGSGLTWKLASTIEGEDNNLALWSLVPNALNSTNRVLQHIASGRYLSFTSPTTLVSNIADATLITSTFNLNNLTSTGRLSSGANFLNMGTNNAVVINTIAPTLTARLTSWVSTSWNLNTIITLLNTISWKPINLSQIPTTITNFSTIRDTTNNFLPIQYASSDGDNRLSITFNNAKGLFSQVNFNSGDIRSGLMTQIQPTIFGDVYNAFLERSNLKTISGLGTDARLYWSDPSSGSVINFPGNLGDNQKGQNTVNYRTQFQMVRTLNNARAFYLYNGVAPDNTSTNMRNRLLGAFFGEAFTLDLQSVNFNNSNPWRFNAWADTTTSSNRVSITIINQAGALYFIRNMSVVADRTHQLIVLPTGVLARWVSHDDRYCIIVDQNGDLLFTPNITISSLRPEWYRVGLPTGEKASTVDLKNNIATILTVSGKVFVSDIFLK